MATHLNFTERKLLARLLKQGYSLAEIARLMGRHRSTISRELKRNTGRRGYRPKQAQRMAEARRRRRGRRCKLADPELNKYVRKRLEKRWSPDQIAGRRRREFPRRRAAWVSRQTIYNWIHRRAPQWKVYLRRGGKPPEKRGKLQDCASIRTRPKVINQRRRYGDWEGDTLVGPRRGNGLLSLVERKSGYTCLARLRSLHTRRVIRAIKRKLGRLPPGLRRSVTFDRGKEFAAHRRLTRDVLSAVYFANAYSPWQRGSVENTNGLIREFFPKGTDFSQVSPAEVARVEDLLNSRPRRRLDYRTPSEVLAKRMCCN